jgi:hypothetical protein
MNAVRLSLAIASLVGLAGSFVACAPTPVRPVQPDGGDADGVDAASPPADASVVPDVGAGPLPSLDAGAPVIDSGFVLDAGTAADADPPPDGAAPADVTTCASGSIGFASNAFGGQTARSTHYELATAFDVATSAEYALLLEAAYESFRHAFGDDPLRNGTGPLKVQLFATREALAAALAATDAGAPPASGALYAPTTKTVYVVVQSSRFATRSALLREAARQFQNLQQRFTNPVLPSWYAEGLVEYLARHDWDGNCVRLGVLPNVTADDAPRAAIQETTVASFKLTSILGQATDGGAAPADAGLVTATRPMSWSIVRFLSLTDRPEWRSNFARYRGLIESSPTTSFASTVGDPSAMQSPLVGFLQAQQEPFFLVAEEWEHVAPNAFFGSAGSSKLGATVVKRSGVTQLETTVRPDSPATFSAGVITSYRDAASFTAVLISGNGVVAEARVDGENVTFTSLGDAPALGAGGTAHMTATYATGSAVVTINGQAFPRVLTATSRAGFVVWGSRVRFGDIVYR